jgi:hypothetical protein
MCYRLFYHIVATDEVSSKITKEFNSSHMRGEINFFLLNRLSSKVHQYAANKVSFNCIFKHYTKFVPLTAKTGR